MNFANKIDVVCQRQQRDYADHMQYNKNYLYFVMRCLIRNALINKLRGYEYKPLLNYVKSIQKTKL